MRRIFISYRRDDSADVSGRIRDRLAEDFGGGAIFTDVDSIPLGVDFHEYIDRYVGQCEVFLPVIGKDWLRAIDDEGKLRLQDPADFVRLEIECGGEAHGSVADYDCTIEGMVQWISDGVTLLPGDVLALGPPAVSGASRWRSYDPNP